jgi:hypothetical protein
MARTSVLPNALRIPALNKLANKRIVLASASPRRLDILKQFVRFYFVFIRFLTVIAGPQPRGRPFQLCGRLGARPL